MMPATDWKPLPDEGPNYLHNEVKDTDEVNESKDGWEWVEAYGLKKLRTSDQQLFQLARAVRGYQDQRGRMLSPEQLDAIFEKWAACSRPFLRRSLECYNIEFLAKLHRVKVPLGQTLRAAFDRAEKKGPPVRVAGIRSKSVQRLASLCRELHQMANGQPIMLHQKSVGELFGHTNHRTTSDWIAALCALGVLKLAVPAIPKIKPAQYFYLE